MTLTYSPPPTEAEAASRGLRILNMQIRHEQRKRGIYEHTEFNRASGLRVLAALRNTPATPGSVLPRTPKFPRDRQVIAAAKWHPASKLSVYLDSQSVEFQRDLQKYGVYVMFELINNRLVPLLVDFSPHYVGMSTMLSTRLKHHVSGYMDNTPADHVLQEFMQTNATTAEQAAYATADRKTQVELRRLAMERRNLWVKTTHAPNAKTAGRLERAMIRHYTDQGYELWNDLLYRDTE